MEIDEIRKYYDETDTASELEAALGAGGGNWETETSEDPLIGTSIRLPRSVLSQVRQEAAARHVTTTGLIRAWITEGLARPAAGSTISNNQDLFEAILRVRQELAGLREEIQPLTEIINIAKAPTKDSAARAGLVGATVSRSGIHIGNTSGKSGWVSLKSTSKSGQRIAAKSAAAEPKMAKSKSTDKGSRKRSPK